MSEKPEQWAVELGLQIFQTVHESVPNRDVLSKAIALTIQRAFEDRTGQLVLIDDQAVERVARGLAVADGIQICSDAIYALSSYGRRAQAAITALRTKP